VTQLAGPPSAASSRAAAPEWWRRPRLDVVDDRLHLGGVELEPLGRAHGTPLFVHDLSRAPETARALLAALATTGAPTRLRFALKANREPEVLAPLRALGTVGIDACSPGEVLHALTNGWRADEISVTATNLSERDLDVILAHDVHLNLDGVSQLERVGRRAPGRTVGFRIDPGAGVGYHEGLEYSGDRPTKFGVTPDRLDEALAAARRHRLTVDTLHFHAGSGWLGGGLPRFEAAVVAALPVLDRLIAAGCPIREVNVGGGLGRVARQDEVPVDLTAYASVLARHLTAYGVTIACEPGDYLMKDTAVLLGEVVTVERRAGTTFVGLDLGFNVNPSYFMYRFAQEVVPLRSPMRARTQLVTIAGHINEAGDVFAEDYPFPAVEEGELVAILNAGGYHQGQSSTHCLRPLAASVFVASDGSATFRAGSSPV
jgi:diaminopimelate decarboxylase